MEFLLDCHFGDILKIFQSCLNFLSIIFSQKYHAVVKVFAICDIVNHNSDGSS